MDTRQYKIYTSIEGGRGGGWGREVGDESVLKIVFWQFKLSKDSTHPLYTK